MKDDYKERMKYKPSNIRVKIYLFLKKIHLVGPIKRIIQKIRVIRKKLGCPSRYVSPEEMEMLKREDMFHRSYQEFFQEIEGYKTSSVLNNVVISGYISTFTKGGNQFFEKLNEQMPEIEWVVLSQSGREVTKREKSKIAFEALSVPRVPFKNGYDKYLDITLTEEMKQTIETHEYLQDAVYNVKSYHDDMGQGYAEALVYYTYLYARVLVEKLHPKMVILHNKLYPMHDVIMNVCNELEVKTLFFEFGALPGTFALEDKGQMGGSHVSVNYEAFMSLPVSSEEINAAKNVCSYLRESGLNRNIQPTTNAKNELLGKIKKGRPIILYAGQNDFDSGICPYKEYSKQLYSPIFKDSNEAAIFLAELAKKNNWNLIYKPHPLPVKHGRCMAESLPQNVIWISDIDINEIIDMADVVVTILSQVGDISLIRGKATLMLGFTQLRGKGCCYEAFEAEQIEKEMKNALTKGFTKVQQDAFVRHVARCLKYYLYDDLSNREIRFGKTIEECADYVHKHLVIGQSVQNEKCLFYCRNLYELEVAFNISSILESGCHKHLMVESDLYQWMQKFLKMQLFEKVFQYDIHKLNEEYTQLFIPAIDGEGEQLYNYLSIRNMGITVHLYDNGSVIEEYNENLLFQQLSDVWMCEPFMRGWNNMSRRIHKVQKKFVLPDNMMVTKQINEKYIFIETDLFEKKIVSNEIDLLDILAENVGIKNIVVKIFSEKSKCRFEMRGYKTMLVSDNEWLLMAKNGSLNNKNIISVYPSNVYLKNVAKREVYLYELFVGRFPVLKCDDFQNSMKKYIEDANSSLGICLKPRNIAEYLEFIKYLERNEG